MANLTGSPFTQTKEALLPILAELSAHEPLFHRSAMASTLDDFARLMAPDYWEIGASGRRYSRAFILDHPARHPPVDAETADWQTSAFACRVLDRKTYLLTYTLQQGDRHTHRTTIWQKGARRWRVLFHQGTIISASDDDTAPA